MKRALQWLVSLLCLAIVLSIALSATWLLWLSPPDPNRLTMYAAQGDLAGVEHCLRRGADPNTPSRWGWNQESQGQTPLTAAAQFGRIDVVRLLLRNGADPNLRDHGPEFPHETPLSTAAMHGQVEVCRVLLDAGADPNILTNPKDSGWTALDWALQAKQPAVADLLRQHGAVESKRRRTE